MKHQAFLIIALAACSGGNKKPEPVKPEPKPVEGIKKMPAPSCASTSQTMATVFFSSLDTPPPEADQKQMHALLKARCEKDRWDDRSKECFATMENTGDVDGCATMLDADQRTKIVAYELIKINAVKGDPGAKPTGPKKTTMQTVLDDLEKFKDKMCACKDMACADKVNADFQKWSGDLEKQFGPDFKPEPKDQERLYELVMQYGDCQGKLMSEGYDDEPPPPEDDVEEAPPPPPPPKKPATTRGGTPKGKKPGKASDPDMGGE